jgi:two-component sensor histidine kinase/CHASE1-domain containing sensor protein
MAGNRVKYFQKINLLKKHLILYSPWIVLVLTILLTLIGWNASVLRNKEKSQQNFNLMSERLARRVEDRMNRYEDILHSTANMFYTLNSVNFQQWSSYLNNLNLAERYPGINTLTYAEYVPEKKRKDFEKEMGQWLPGAKIWPPQKKADHIVVKYTVKDNMNAVGLDISTDSKRMSTVAISRDSGLPAITGKTSIFAKQNRYPGFILYLPLYNNPEKSNSVAERRKNFKGLIAGIFIINEFLQEVLKGDDDDKIDFEVFDGEELSDNSLLFDKNNAISILDPGYKPAFSNINSFKIYNHSWTIYSIPTRDFVMSNNTTQPLFILLGGLALSLSLFGFIRALLLTQNMAMEIAGQMTAELEEKEAFIRELYNTTSSHAKFSDKVSFLLAMGCEKLGLKNGILARIKKDSYEILQIHSEDYSYKPGEVLNISDAYIKKLSMMIEPTGFIDSKHSEIINNELYNKLKFESYLSTQVIVNGNIYGTLDFSDISPRINNFTDTDRTIVKLIAQWIGNEMERNYADEKIKASLKEKEILLKEIHHRVKNNLQVVSSLLSIQSAYIKDKKALEIFRESQLRIKSMALIHQNLYQTEHLAKINFALYVEKLLSYLFQSFGVNQNLIRMKIDIGDIPVDLDSAIPCGLIINELVSNSLKYAFLTKKEGYITISLSVSNNNYLLKISDNGDGIPNEIDFYSTKTLGLQLVNTLVAQLEGNIQLNKSAPDTEFVINFPNPKQLANLS